MDKKVNNSAAYIPHEDQFKLHYREFDKGQSSSGDWWCCNADYPSHEYTCPNFKPDIETIKYLASKVEDIEQYYPLPLNFESAARYQWPDRWSYLKRFLQVK